MRVAFIFIADNGQPVKTVMVQKSKEQQLYLNGYIQSFLIGKFTP